MRVALIDADPMIYVLAWKYRDVGLEAKEEVCDAAEAFLKYILDITYSDSYIGSFSCSTKDNFRTEIYKYAPYKGKRPEKDPWYTLWEPIIKEFLYSRHNFLRPVRIEADDVVSLWAEKIKDVNRYVICTPDKDMDQIPGLHFAYSKKDAVPYQVSIADAKKSLYMQMLTGDGTDNIAGIPGFGPVKAQKLLQCEPMEVTMHIRAAYCKYFGDYYGNIILEETKYALILLKKWAFLEYDIYTRIGGVTSEATHVTSNIPNIFTPTRKPLSLFEQMILQ